MAATTEATKANGLILKIVLWVASVTLVGLFGLFAAVSARDVQRNEVGIKANADAISELKACTREIKTGFETWQKERDQDWIEQKQANKDMMMALNELLKRPQ